MESFLFLAASYCIDVTSFTLQTLSQELSPTGGKVVAIKCDVSKEEDILSMMSAIKSQFGGADICINNAGLGHYATLLDGSSAMWKEMFEVYHINKGVALQYILYYNFPPQSR